MREDKRQRSSAIIYALWLALLCAPGLLWGFWLPLQLAALVCVLYLAWRALPWAALLALLGRW